MNKIGIYYAYWTHDWDADFHPFIDRVAGLGFDVLEVNAGTVAEMTSEERRSLNAHADEKNLALGYCIGLPHQYDLASLDSSTHKQGVAYLQRLAGAIGEMGGGELGGIIYGAWPANLPAGQGDKRPYVERSIAGMREAIKAAQDTFKSETTAARDARKAALDAAHSAYKTAASSATTTRKTALDAANTAYKTAVVSASSTRASALAAANALTDPQAKRDAIKAAQKNYREAVKAAQEIRKAARKAAQEAYRSAVKTVQETRKAARKAAEEAYKTAAKASREKRNAAIKAAQDTFKTERKACKNS